MNSGTPRSESVEVCARCGHTTPTCNRCGRNDPFLGGRIGDETYCHTFSEAPGEASCYTRTLWGRR